MPAAQVTQSPAQTDLARFELEHWYQPAPLRVPQPPERVWSRSQFHTRGEAEARLAYLTEIAERPDRPPPGVARPTRLRLVERVELADVRPSPPPPEDEPPMHTASVGWRTYRGPAVLPQGRVTDPATDPDEDDGDGAEAV